MSKNDEEILWKISDIRYKKNDGMLILFDKRICWMVPNDEKNVISISYSDIRNQKISPDAKPKVQLQLVLADTNSHIFHFANQNGREKQISERNAVKERLCQLIQLSKRKAPDELMEKKRVLEENPHLKELYLALVRTNILSSEEFWKEIAGQYKKILPPALDVGVSGAFLVDIKPQTDGSNGSVQYNLTPEIMTSVFKTYPAVKRKHEEYVPHKMSETEFWTRFFQSHYYSAHTTSRSENVFSECTKYDDKEWARDLITVNGETLYNLKEIYEDKPLDPETDPQKKGSITGSNHIHATMIKRFNQHSQNILKSQTTTEKEKLCEEMMAKDPTAIPTKNSQPDLNIGKSKKMKLSEKLEYSDLELAKTCNDSALVIHQKDRYLSGPTPDVAPDFRPSEIKALGKRLNDTILSYDQDLFDSQSSTIAYKVTENFALACRKGRTNVGTRSGEALPKYVQGELSKIYSSAGELLRHFWACFPPRTPQLQEKLHRMHKTLCLYHQNTVREFQEQAIKEYNCKNSILDHLQGMFEIANMKYETWKSRNGQ